MLIVPQSCQTTLEITHRLEGWIVNILPRGQIYCKLERGSVSVINQRTSYNYRK